MNPDADGAAPRVGRPPTTWAFTDLLSHPDWRGLVARVPPGGGIVFREYRHPDRDVLARHVRDACRRAGLYFVIAGDAATARRLGGGMHVPSRHLHRPAPADLFSTAAVHDAREMAAAIRAGHDAVFISPVFRTASHPGVPGLGPVRFRRIARAATRAGVAVFALGGMDEDRWKRLGGARSGFDGFASVGRFAHGARPTLYFPRIPTV